MSEGDAGRDESQGTPGAAAGWYPDPHGSGTLFYWDGERWTGDSHSASPVQADTATPSQREPGRRTMIGGGVAFAISPFLPWVKVILLGNLNLFQVFDATGKPSIWAWVVLFEGVGVAVLAYRRRNPRLTRRLALGVGLVFGLAAIVALEKLLHELRDAHGLATVGIGPYVAVAGCVAMVVGWVLARRGRAAASSAS